MKRPPAADTFYARTKLEAEGIVLQAINAAGEPLGTVLRLAAVYGTRIKGNYDQLLKALHRGWFLPLGRGENRRTLVYDRDVALAAVLALDCPEAASRIYNVTDGRWYSLNEIIATLCEALGRRPPRWSLPLPLVRALVGFAERTAGRLGVSLPLNRSRIDKYTEDVAVEGCRIQRELGFKPRFDLARGWADAVREMGLTGKTS
jgi:UDP-glucose 4-epimerase